jgi:hypothetical protein
MVVNGIDPKPLLDQIEYLFEKMLAPTTSCDPAASPASRIITVAGGQASDLVWHLRYDDEYLRTHAGWRIHGRALTINAVETRSVRRLRGRP